MIYELDTPAVARHMARYCDRWCYLGGGKTTSSQKTEYDPAYMARINANYDRTQGIANSPFQAYTGERVADFSPTGLEANSFLKGVANDTSTNDAIGKSMGVMGGILNYRPQTVTPQTITPQSIFGTHVTAAPVNVGMLRDTDLSKYMNPYTQSVIDASLSDLSHARDVQQVKDNQTATAAHAFGGSRQAVRDAVTNDGYLRNVASTTANLRDQGFRTAQDAAIGDITRKYAADAFNSGQKLTADTFNSGQDFAGGQFNANMDYNSQVANAGNRMAADQFNVGTGLDLQRLLGTAAGNYATLAQQAYGNNVQRGGILAGIGAQEQAISQARDDAAYEEFLRQLNDPLIKQQLLNSSLSTFPVQATTTNTQATSPGLGGILGGIGSLALGIGSMGTSTIGGSLLGFK